jgi:hypothetical protein
MKQFPRKGRNLFCPSGSALYPKWIFGLAAPLRFSGDRVDDLAACVSGFDVLQSRHCVGQRVGPVDDGSEGANKEQGLRRYRSRTDAAVLAEI